jgi:hypothetical protein
MTEIQASGCIAADAEGVVHAVDTTAFVLARCGKLRALCMEVEPGWDFKTKGLKEIGVPHGYTHSFYRLIQYCIVKSITGAGSKGGHYVKKSPKGTPKGTPKKKIGPVKVRDLTLFATTDKKNAPPVFTGIKVRRNRVLRSRIRRSLRHSDPHPVVS